MWTMDDNTGGKVTLDTGTFIAMQALRPNPENWTDTNGAAEILDRTRSSVVDFVAKGTITKHLIGGMPAYWVPELKEVRDALARLNR